ncbi:hypothetical protein FRC08_016467, partial [Ceratobasidium sp. 394]
MSGRSRGAALRSSSNAPSAVPQDAPDWSYERLATEVQNLQIALVKVAQKIDHIDEQISIIHGNQDS